MFQLICTLQTTNISWRQISQRICQFVPSWTWTPISSWASTRRLIHTDTFASFRVYHFVYPCLFHYFFIMIDNDWYSIWHVKYGWNNHETIEVTYFSVLFQSLYWLMCVGSVAKSAERLTTHRCQLTAFEMAEWRLTPGGHLWLWGLHEERFTACDRITQLQWKR